MAPTGGPVRLDGQQAVLYRSRMNQSIVPPDLQETGRPLLPALERIVTHCLEESPEQRFHSAHDLAFDLKALATTTATSTAVPLIPASAVRGRRAVFVSVLLVAGLALGVLADRMLGPKALFTELPEGAGEGGATYLRRTDGSPAVRLGDGEAQALSPDGKWALSIRTSASPSTARGGGRPVPPGDPFRNGRESPCPVARPQGIAYCPNCHCSSDCARHDS